MFPTTSTFLPTGGCCQFSNDRPQSLSSCLPKSTSKVQLSLPWGQVGPPGPSSTLLYEQLLRAVQLFLDDSEAGAQRQGLAEAGHEGGVGGAEQALDLRPEA